MQQVVKRGGKALLVAPAATAGKCCAGMHTRHISQLAVWESNKETGSTSLLLLMLAVLSCFVQAMLDWTAEPCP